MSPTSNSSTIQHYVPQLLLRGFATPKKEQVYVFDKQAETVFLSSVRNLACERGFYYIEDGGDPERLDRWIRQLEEQTAPILKSICSRRLLNHLHPTDRRWIAAFIAVQHLSGVATVTALVTVVFSLDDEPTVNSNCELTVATNGVCTTP
jgi:hypothetical protein